MDIIGVPIRKPDDTNFILGQTHFIKSVEDLHEALVGAVPGIKFGLAFCEASGACLIRLSGTDDAMTSLARDNAQAIAAGHSFIIFLANAYPINVLNAVKNVPEVCQVFCATANPTTVVVAESGGDRGILGVIDGSSPKGVEDGDGVSWRKSLLRGLATSSRGSNDGTAGATMRVLVLSDIHSNSVALEAVLADAGPVDADVVPGRHRRLRAVHPMSAWSMLAGRAPDLLCVAGNHDRGVLGGSISQAFIRTPKRQHDGRRDNWRQRRVAFLSSFQIRSSSDEFTLVHGSPRQPVWEYILSPRWPLTISPCSRQPSACSAIPTGRAILRSGPRTSADGGPPTSPLPSARHGSSSTRAASASPATTTHEQLTRSWTPRPDVPSAAWSMPSPRPSA